MDQYIRYCRALYFQLKACGLCVDCVHFLIVAILFTEWMENRPGACLERSCDGAALAGRFCALSKFRDY